MDTGSLLLLRRDTGYDCGNDRDCLMDDGSGYYVPTIDEVTIRASGPWGNGHNFHTVHINVTDATEVRSDPTPTPMRCLTAPNLLWDPT